MLKRNNLLNTVLRDEWGFKGFVLTDYFGGYGYQNGDQEIRNGNDSMLATTKITNHITDKSATSVKAMRTAAHNILYTTANGWQYENGEPEVDTPVAQRDIRGLGRDRCPGSRPRGPDHHEVPQAP